MKRQFPRNMYFIMLFLLKNVYAHMYIVTSAQRNTWNDRYQIVNIGYAQGPGA